MKPTEFQLEVVVRGRPRVHAYTFNGVDDKESLEACARRLTGSWFAATETTLGICVIDRSPGVEPPTIAPLRSLGKEPHALLLAELFAPLGLALNEAIRAGGHDEIMCGLFTLLGMQHSRCTPVVHYDVTLLETLVDLAHQLPGSIARGPAIGCVEIGGMRWRHEPRGVLKQTAWASVRWDRAAEAERAA